MTAEDLVAVYFRQARRASLAAHRRGRSNSAADRAIARLRCTETAPFLTESGQAGWERCGLWHGHAGDCGPWREGES